MKRCSQILLSIMSMFMSTITSVLPKLPPLPYGVVAAVSAIIRTHPAWAIADTAPITLAFHQAELSAVLKAFADFTGLNIIASDHVQGKVSMRLDKVPWQRAFNMLLDAQGLAMQRRGNVIWVMPADELARHEQQRFAATARAADLEPLTSHIFKLHYQRAEEVRKLIAGADVGTAAMRILSKRGAAIADSRTNQLFVTDTAGNIRQIQTILLAIDQPIRQVLIEARIVEAEEGFARSLGARLSLLGSATEPTTPDGTLNNTQAATYSYKPQRFLTAANGTMYDLPAGPLGGFNPVTVGFTLFGAGANRVIALELSMLEADGRGRILSSPRVVTADRVKALIEQGTELPYQAKVGNGVSGVQFRRAGLKLEVTPHITSGSHLILDVDVSKDSVGAETSAGPAISTKHVQTQVQVENGGTVAIGGIFSQDKRADIVRVPWLGKLPIIGALFRRSVKNERKSELLIFITPNIIAMPSPHRKMQ